MKLSAKQIKHYREVFGMSQGQLAKKIGISTVMLGFIEREERTLNHAVASKAADALLQASENVLKEAEVLRSLAIQSKGDGSK